MKIYRVLVPLLILLAGYTYANDNEVEGFLKKDCRGDSMTADNLDELDDMYGETDENDTTWNFRSYWYTSKKDECLEYIQDMPEVKVIGQRLPKFSPISNGDAGGGRGIPVDVKDRKNEGEDYTPDDFDQDMDCWKQGMDDLKVVTNWTGEYTDATWLSDPEHNTYLSIDKNESRFGHTSYTDPWDVVDADDVSIRFWVHPVNIGTAAILRTEAPFKHLMLYWMMHEFVHVLQAVHERDDGDNQFVPHASGSWEREMEAHSILEKWWKARFGVDAPYKAPNRNKPRKWDKNAEEYDALVAKKTKGKNWTKDDEDRLEELEGYFRNNYPKEVDNRGYKADEAELNCD